MCRRKCQSLTAQINCCGTGWSRPTGGQHRLEQLARPASTLRTAGGGHVEWSDGARTRTAVACLRHGARQRNGNRCRPSLGSGDGRPLPKRRPRHRMERVPRGVEEGLETYDSTRPGTRLCQCRWKLSLRQALPVHLRMKVSHLLTA